MKKTTFFLLLILLAIKAVGQTTPKMEFSKEYYLQKSKNQKTTGWIMFGSGALMAVVGGIGFGSGMSDDLLSDSSNSSTDTYGFIMLGGIATSLGSIPFFIGSAKNARKAATLTLNYKPSLQPQQNAVALNYQPSLSLKINF